MALVAVLLVLTVALMSVTFERHERAGNKASSAPTTSIYIYSQEDLPDNVRALLEKHPEASSFAAGYTEHAGEDAGVVDLSSLDLSTVPLLMQWDTRWGYQSYSGSVIGLAGCGPTCLSQVAIYLLGDTTLNPAYIASFATTNGYAIEGNGTDWELMSYGAQKLGLVSTEVPLHEQSMVNELTAGHPIICVMGPGDFTDTGHFIVLTGYSDGAFTVNDPNCTDNSSRTWTYDELASQIRAIWSYSAS